MKNVNKKLVIRIGSGVLAAGVVVGAVFGIRAARGGSGAVGVYELSSV